MNTTIHQSLCLQGVLDFAVSYANRDSSPRLQAQQQVVAIVQATEFGDGEQQPAEVWANPRGEGPCIGNLPPSQCW